VRTHTKSDGDGTNYDARVSDLFTILMPLSHVESRIGGKASLGKTRTTRDLHKYFLHKGKRMEKSSREISPKIARQRDRAHDHVMNTLAVSVKGLQPKRILDVGTGYGMSLTFLACRFGRCALIWSVDASPAVVHEMKKIMRKRQYSRHVIVKQASAEQLPFQSAHFQLVVSLFAFHHLSNPKRGLFEMERVLSQGGKLIIADWRPEAGKPLMLHAPSDIPSPTFVTKQFERLGYRTKSRIRPYWYLIEAIK
jgi:ubiquinone/menaquinone biosynthesis C-methylase UbiE